MDVRETGVSRRQALRAGMYVAGTAWVAPALVVIGAGPASADTASGGVPTTSTTTHTTPPTTSTTSATSATTTTTTSTTSTTTGGRHESVGPTVLGNQLENPPNDQAAAPAGLSLLPRTGADVAGVALLGAGLVAGGAAARIAARQGKHADAADEA